MVAVLVTLFVFTALASVIVSGVLIYRVDNGQAIRNARRSKNLRVQRARRVAAFRQAWSLN